MHIMNTVRTSAPNTPSDPAKWNTVITKWFQRNVAPVGTYSREELHVPREI